MVILEITPEIIQKAIPCDSGSCPIALAFMEQVPNMEWVVVEPDGIWYMDYDGNHGSYFMSGRLKQQLKNFDSGRGFVQGQYVIDEFVTPQDYYNPDERGCA